MTEVKTRLILNLTKRQVICFGIAGVIGIPLFLATRGALGNSGGMLLMIAAAMPAFFFAIYNKDGIPAEKFLLYVIRQKFFFPKIRPYKTENLYAYIEKEGSLEHKQKTHGTARRKVGGKRSTASGKQKAVKKAPA
jgi:hypothetical protein